MLNLSNMTFLCDFEELLWVKEAHNTRRGGFADNEGKEVDPNRGFRGEATTKGQKEVRASNDFKVQPRDPDVHQWSRPRRLRAGKFHPNGKMLDVYVCWWSTQSTQTSTFNR